MSFLATFFAINIKSFPHGADGSLELSLGYVSQYVFGVGVAIAAVCVALAFFIERLLARCKVMLWNRFDRFFNRPPEPNPNPILPSQDDDVQPTATSQNSSVGQSSNSTVFEMKRLRFHLPHERDVEQG